MIANHKHRDLYKFLYVLDNEYYYYLNIISSNKFISKVIIKKYIDKFQIDPVKYSHSLSMLLTLSMFNEEYYK